MSIQLTYVRYVSLNFRGEISEGDINLGISNKYMGFGYMKIGVITKQVNLGGKISIENEPQDTPKIITWIKKEELENVNEVGGKPKWYRILETIFSSVSWRK